ncbi:MAG: transcription elongation protein SprT [Flavobacteriaceae bacterium]|nr:transcription elongation protein SprT [Flavobacteriaceae bacterium]
MFTEELNKYLIPGALHFVNKWCKGYGVDLIIKNARQTKLGDYRKAGNRHQITLNYGLDKELSFHILTHEIAHMHARVKYGPNIKPHGIEWKITFSDLIYESLHLFKDEFQLILKDFAPNPRAGYYSYPPIAEYFQRKENPDRIVVKDMAFGSIFRSGNKIFKKVSQNKIRYICIEINTGRRFTVHPLAPVDEIIKNQS